VSENFYERFGGALAFERLVHTFYHNVKNDPLLSPMYPEGDFEGAERRLRMFLEQYWGGPHTYSDERGHPRLRMRHAPFPIGIAERDAWLACMKPAVEEMDLDSELHSELWGYLEGAATFMMNQ
jgi:hemoglobin